MTSLPVTDRFKSKGNSSGGGLPSLFASTIKDTDKIGQKRFSSTQKYVQKDIELGSVIGKDLKEKLTRQLPGRTTSVSSDGRRRISTARKKGGVDIFALMDSAMETGPTEEAKQKARDEAATRKALEEAPMPKIQKVVKPKPSTTDAAPPSTTDDAPSSSTVAQPSTAAVPPLFAATVGSAKEPAWKMRIKSVGVSIDKAVEVVAQERAEPALTDGVANDQARDAASAKKAVVGELVSPRRVSKARSNLLSPGASSSTSSSLPKSSASPLTSPTPRSREPAWKARMRQAQLIPATFAEETTTEPVLSPVVDKRPKEIEKSEPDHKNNHDIEEDDEDDFSVSVSDVESDENDAKKTKVVTTPNEAFASPVPTNKEPAWKARQRDAPIRKAASNDEQSTDAKLMTPPKTPKKAAKAEPETKSPHVMKEAKPRPAPETKSPHAMNKAKTRLVVSVKDTSPKTPKTPKTPKVGVVTASRQKSVGPKALPLLASNVPFTTNSDRMDRSSMTVSSREEEKTQGPLESTPLKSPSPSKPRSPEAPSPTGNVTQPSDRQDWPTSVAADSTEDDDNYPSAFKFTALPTTSTHRIPDSDSSDSDYDSDDDDIRGAFHLGSGDGGDTAGLPSADIHFSVDHDIETRQFILSLQDGLHSSKPMEWYKDQIKETEKRLAVSIANHKLQKAELKKIVDRKKESMTDIFEGKMEVRLRMGAIQNKTFQKAYGDEQKIVESLRKENKRVRGEVNKLPQQIMATKSSIIGIEEANKEIEGHLESLGKFAKKLERDHERLQASSTKCRDQYLPRYREELRQREAHIETEARIKNLYRSCILKISRRIGERKKVELLEEINQIILETEADVNPKFDPAVLFDTDSDSGSSSDSDSDSSSSSGS